MTQDGSGVKFDHFIGSYYIIVYLLGRHIFSAAAAAAENNVPRTFPIT
jgi:hypothetical protein